MWELSRRTRERKKMRYDVQLYIGHNVGTKRVHTEKSVIDALAAVDIEGATIFEAHGIWHGMKEFTSVVEICDVNSEWVDELKAKIIPRLCDALSQEAILCRVSPSNAEFICATC